MDLNNKIPWQEKKIIIAKDFKKYRFAYLLAIPVILWYLILCYGPMWGILIAFKDFKPLLGFDRSKNECAFIPKLAEDFLQIKNDILYGLFGENSKYAYTAYEKLAEGKSLSEDEQKSVWSRIITDYMYRTHSDNLVQILATKGQPVWSYSFEWNDAVHALDMQVFWRNHRSFQPKLTDEKLSEADRLSDNLNKIYTNFIIHGDPNHADIPQWNSYSINKQKLLIGGKCTKKEITKPDSLQGFVDYAIKLTKNKYRRSEKFYVRII